MLGAASSIGTISLSHTAARDRGGGDRAASSSETAAGDRLRSGSGAKPSLRSREGRDVDLTGLHVQPRLAVGDMSARQAADSFSEEKNQMLHLAAPTARRRRSTWGKRARRGQADCGRATPSLRQPAHGAILILIVATHSHLDCRGTSTGSG
jgi:hypothetical protein